MSDSVGMRNYNDVRMFRKCLYLCLLLAGALSGCASRLPASSAEGAPNVNLAGFPADYRKAHGEGCTHARSGGSLAQAPAFQQGGSQVAQGWRDGFDYCKGKPR